MIKLGKKTKTKKKYHEIEALNAFKTRNDLIYLPLRFRKARKVWCGGARETHWASCHNGVTPSKTEGFIKSPWLLDLNGIINDIINILALWNRYLYEN